MRIYLDLQKALSSVPNTGQDTSLEDRSNAQYESSYARQYAGVAAGEVADYDQENVGAKYSHSEKNSHMAKVDAARAARKTDDDAPAAAEGMNKAEYFAVSPKDEKLKEFEERHKDEDDEIAKSESTQEYVQRMLKKHGLEGVNKPKLTPGHAEKKGIVLAKEGDTVKLIRFGAKGYKHNYSAEGRSKFKARHAKNIARGKLSAAYWADKVLWAGPKGHKQTRETVKKSLNESLGSVGLTKSLEAIDTLSELNKSLEQQSSYRHPTPVEREFLLSQGYTDDDIRLGRAIIKGYNRHLFSTWLCDRVSMATEDLKKALGS